MLAAAIQSRPLRRPALLRWVQPLGEAGISIYVGGVAAMDLVDLETLTKEESGGFDRSNTLSFTCWRENPPTPGQEIIVYRGGTLEREFAGVVMRPEQFYDGIRHNLGWRIRCQDYTWLFNDERYSYKWPGAVSATDIAGDIVAFKAGFTTSNIEAALPDVDDFEIINKTRGEALKLLAARVPGLKVLKVDYSKDVHFRITPVFTVTPADIDDVTKSGDNLVKSADLGQARTRQRGLGVRVRISALIPSGSTTVAVEAVDRLPASGQLQVGSRILTFSAQSQTQSPSGIAGTAGAPTVALASSPAGGVIGAVRYCITFETPDGETPPGTQSSQVTGATLAAPSTASAYDQHQNGVGTTSNDWYYSSGVTFTRSGTRFSFSLSNMVAGARIYIYASSTGVFDGAWTIAEVSGSTCYVDGISSSAGSSDTGNLQVITDGPLVSGGTFSYKLAWISPRGISALSSAFTISPAAVSVSASATASGTTGGNLTLTSAYTYYYTAYTESGETSPLALLGSAYTLTGSNNAITLGSFSQLSNSNGWHDLRVRGLRLYRGRAGESVPRLVADFSRSTLAALGAFTGTWSYTDTLADTSLGRLPISGPIGASVGIAGLPSFSDARATGLMILRTVAGGSTYYQVGTVTSAASASGFLDAMSDADLVRQPPAPTESFGGHCVSLTSIATGAASTTARNIYRLFNGVWRYCGTITNNTDTTFTDDKADDELGRPLAIGGYLTGITATTDDIVAGEIGRLHVVRDDAAAQTALAAAFDDPDFDGVVEGPVLDNDTLEQDALEAACDGELEIFSAGLEETAFRSRDVGFNEGPGKSVTFNLADTTDITGTFYVQTVTTKEYGRADDLQPLRVVKAGPLSAAFQRTQAS